MAADPASNRSLGMTFSSLQRDNRPSSGLRPPLESPAQLALIAVVVWFIGFVFHPLALLVPVGLALLLVAGAAYLLRPKRRSMYWRGRELDLSDGSSTAARLYYKVFRR
jgi:cbb3-type cytochrome oxidase subunit 3